MPRRVDGARRAWCGLQPPIQVVDRTMVVKSVARLLSSNAGSLNHNAQRGCHVNIEPILQLSLRLASFQNLAKKKKKKSSRGTRGGGGWRNRRGIGNLPEKSSGHVTFTREGKARAAQGSDGDILDCPRWTHSAAKGHSKEEKTMVMMRAKSKSCVCGCVGEERFKLIGLLRIFFRLSRFGVALFRLRFVFAAAAAAALDSRSADLHPRIDTQSSSFAPSSHPSFAISGPSSTISNADSISSSSDAAP